MLVYTCLNHMNYSRVLDLSDVRALQKRIRSQLAVGPPRVLDDNDRPIRLDDLETVTRRLRAADTGGIQGFPRDGRGLSHTTGERWKGRAAA